MHNVMTKRWILVILSLVLLLTAMPLFAACGDDDEDEDINIPPVTTTSQPPTTSEAAGLGFSVDSTIAELAANPCARTILAKYFGGEDKVQMAEQAVPDFTMRDAQKLSDAVSLEQLEQMDAELKAIVSCEETTEPPATTTAPTTTEPVAKCDLTIDSKMGDLLDNPDAKAILEKYLPPDIMAKAGLVRGFALPVLAPQSNGAVTDEMLAAIAADLKALCGGEPVAKCDLTIDSKMGDLLDNPDAKAILEKYLPPDIMAKAGLVRGFALPVLAPQSNGAVTDEILAAIATDLEVLCGGGPPTTTTAAPTTTPSKLTGEPVKIGVMVPYSGSGGMAGLLTNQVLDVSDYLLQQRGGILGGKPVEWVKYDTAGDIAKAQAGVQKLAGDDGVLAITIGGVTGGEQTAVVIAADDLRIPYFSVSTWTGLPEYRYSVRTSVETTDRAAICAEYALEHFDPSTAAYLGDATDDGHDVIARAKEILEDAGVETVYEQFPVEGTNDFTPYLTSIRAEKPDVLIHYIAASPTATQSLYKQITGLGGWGNINVFGVTSAVADFPKESGAEGTYFWAYSFPGSDYPGAKTFEEAWQTVEGDVPNSIHIMVFNCIWSAVEAIDQAGVGADREDIAELIRSGTFGWESPGGLMMFGTDGEPSIKGLVAMIKGGEAVPAP